MSAPGPFRLGHEHPYRGGEARHPDCGEEMGCLGADVSELLEYVPALLHVIEYHIKKYACRECQNGVVQARVPARPIPKGRPGPGLLAYLLVSKYHDHLPLARLERIFERAGAPISRKTLCDWTQAAAELLSPVVEAVKSDLRRSTLLQANETPVQVRDPDCEREKKSRTAWIWTYGIPDGEVVYDFSNTRSRDAPLALLGEFSGYLQSDCYSVYTSLDENGRITHVGDWAHARRRFFDARGEKPEFAELVLAAIQKLFRIERRAREDGITGGALVAKRREEALPILRKLKEILEAKRPDVLPKSGLGDAIAYSLNNWKALERYVDIPEAKIDNNGAERTMRRIVMGRNNWLFIGHPNAGPRAAVIFSLIESCRRLNIEPLEYLKSVLESLSKDPSRAAELTPRKWRDARDAARSTAAA